MTQNNLLSPLNRGARSQGHNLLYTQTCFSKIEKSSRCRLYRNIKEVHDTEFHLRQQYTCHLRQGLSKIRLISHKFFVERGRWSKPKVEYIDRLCTLCDHKMRTIY